MKFQWNKEKERKNIEKHGVSFEIAKLAFSDENRVIDNDTGHSYNEERLFCYGFVDGDVLTVRFTMRNDAIRIFGAAYWRKGRKIYEKAQ